MLGLNNWMIAALSGVVVLSGLGLWILGTKVDELTKEKAQLELAIQVQKSATDSAMKAVDTWKESAEGLQKTLTAMSANQLEATKETRRLNELFTKHDLGALAKAKPGLIGRRINSGSNSMLRMLEDASSGSGTNNNSITTTPQPTKTDTVTPH